VNRKGTLLNFFNFAVAEIDVVSQHAGQKGLPESGDENPGWQTRMERRVCLFDLRVAIPSRSNRPRQAIY
jgi:hypothetical protein